jgi:hypothetical protein
MKKYNTPLFLSTSFSDALGATTGYSVYNFDSAWLMRVEVKPRTRIEGYGEDAHEVPAEGYAVKRHGKHGEIPDFAWYRDEFPDLYPYTRMKDRKKKGS